MPKKITNPLREGLPSKIYLLAYGDHVSGYEIAKRIYGKEYRIPPTAKVYGWLKKLEKDNIVSIGRGEKKGGITSNVDPLINEVEKDLKDRKVELSDFERHVLGKILDSQIFRDLVKETAESLPLEYDIDAVRTIMSGVCRVAFFICTIPDPFFTKSFLERENELPKTQQDFDKLWSRLMKFSGELENKIKAGIKAGKIKEGKISLKDAEMTAFLFVISGSLLQKLATLSDPMDKVTAAIYQSFSEFSKALAEKNFPDDRLKDSLDKLFQTLDDEFGGGRDGKR